MCVLCFDLKKYVPIYSRNLFAWWFIYQFKNRKVFVYILYIYSVDIFITLFDDLFKFYLKTSTCCLGTGQPCFEQLDVISDCEVDKWREILEVNVLALCICSKEFLLSAKRRNLEQGHIININRSVSDEICTLHYWW